MTNKCYGCDIDDPEEDHYHQYVNRFERVTACWYVNGRPFLDSSDTIVYLEAELGFSVEQAQTYIHNLPKRFI